MFSKNRQKLVQRLRAEINAWLDTLTHVAGFAILLEEGIWHELSRALPLEVAFALVAGSHIAHRASDAKRCPHT